MIQKELGIYSKSCISEFYRNFWCWNTGFSFNVYIWKNMLEKNQGIEVSLCVIECVESFKEA